MIPARAHGVLVYLVLLLNPPILRIASTACTCLVVFAARRTWRTSSGNVAGNAAKDLRRAVAAKDATRVASESTIRSVSNAADVIDAVGREIRRKRLAKVLRGETLGAEERGGGAFEAIREAVRAAAKAAADAVADPSSRSENRAMAVVDDPTLEPEVRELVFEREFERVARYEKTKAWTNCVAVGGEPTGEGERAAVARRRAARDDVVNALEAANAVARLAEGKRLVAGAGYDVDEINRVTHDRTESRVIEDGPTFHVHAADTWETRREALDRFTQAGRRVILRNRAERRLRGIRTLMASVGEKSRASAYVARDLLGAGSNDAEVREPARMTPARVYDFSFPTLRESRFCAREPVDLAGSEIREWDDPRPMALRDPPAWRLTGHALDDGAAKPPRWTGTGTRPSRPSSTEARGRRGRIERVRAAPSRGSGPARGRRASFRAARQLRADETTSGRVVRDVVDGDEVDAVRAATRPAARFPREVRVRG